MVFFFKQMKVFLLSLVKHILLKYKPQLPGTAERAFFNYEAQHRHRFEMEPSFTMEVKTPIVGKVLIFNETKTSFSRVRFHLRKAE